MALRLTPEQLSNLEARGLRVSGGRIVRTAKAVVGPPAEPSSPPPAAMPAMLRNSFLRHKFHARSVKLDGFHFPSQAEGQYYELLKLKIQSGEVIGFLRQVPFHLSPGVTYVCDFLVFWANGEVTFDEVKGMSTPAWAIKRKLVAEKYPWAKIRVFKKLKGGFQLQEAA